MPQRPYADRLRLAGRVTEPAIRRAIEEFAPPQGSRGLDAGCGIGLRTLCLAEAVGEGGNVTGLDISPDHLAEARNVGENAAYQSEKQLGELGDQLDDASKTEIEEAIKAVRDSLESEDAEEIKAKTDALQAAFHKVSEQIYQAASEQQAASGADGAGATNGAAAEEEVVDAEVVDDERS